MAPGHLSLPETTRSEKHVEQEAKISKNHGRKKNEENRLVTFARQFNHRISLQYHDTEKREHLRLSLARTKVIIMNPGRPRLSDGIRSGPVNRRNRNCLLRIRLSSRRLRRGVSRRLSRVTEHPLHDVPDRVAGPLRVPERYRQHCSTRR